MSKGDGGSVFPTTMEQLRTTIEGHGNMMGMSLRDYFAGQAITGVLASQHQEAWDNPDKAAAWAYEYADAMLAAREGP